MQNVTVENSTLVQVVFRSCIDLSEPSQTVSTCRHFAQRILHGAESL